MKHVKNIMGTGIASMAGLAGLGAMGSIPGMPSGAGSITGIASSGMQLANIGPMVQAGMSIMGNKRQRIRRDKGKNCSRSIINRII